MILKKLIGLVVVIFMCSFLSAQNWQTNWKEAQVLSKEENKPIVLVFQGSDWCGPCIKLDKKIWSTPEFIEYANNHFIMFKADFPRKKENQLSKEMTKQNNTLAEKYNSQGYFPMVVILSPQGKVAGKTGYKKLDPTEYIAHINQFLE